MAILKIFILRFSNDNIFLLYHLIYSTWLMGHLNKNKDILVYLNTFIKSK